MSKACVSFAAFSAGAVLALAALLAPGKALADDAQDYAKFMDFCVQRFGAEKEPLVRATFGKDPAFRDGGTWVYASETSACVAFETNLPTKGSVEFGPTAQYGTSLPGPERFLYLHLHYIAGLNPGTEYHLRLSAVDERGNKLTSKDMTFRTATPKNVVRVPDDLGEPPFVLDKPGTTYLVTKDLTVEGTAFDVKAANVTLDLGGHTVVYDNKEWGPLASKEFPDWIRDAKYGLRAMKSDGLKVLNGTIRQGDGNDRAEANSIGFNPLYLNGSNKLEVAGVTVIYSGSQQVGIYCHWGGNDSDFHHNVFDDRGTQIFNRHGAGSRALLFYGSRDNTGIRAHHNLVLRTRQGGVGGNEVFNNEIYMDSWATNSFGVGLMSGGTAWGNRIFGTGYHVCAFGWGTKQTFHDNFVQLEGCALKGRWKEYGDQVSLNGFRLTQYAGSKWPYEDELFYNNVVVINARDECQSRGVQFFSDPFVKGLLFRNNTVKVLAGDAQTKQVACVVTQGLQDRTAEHQPIVYKDDTLISNLCNVRFGDYYGVGSNHQFVGCRFVKVGADPRYRTFIFDSGYPCRDHVIRDCTFEGGAGPDSVEWGDPKSDHDFTVQWTLTVRTAPGAKVTIKDKEGKEAFSGVADAKGVASAPLSQYRAKATGKTMLTPHTVTVDAGGKVATKEVTMDRKQEMAL